MVQKAGRLDPLSPQFLSKIEGDWSHTTLTLPPTPRSTPIISGVYERSGFPCQMVIHFLSSFLTCSIWGSLHVCIFNIIVLLLAISHARASFSDPGKLQLIYVNPQKLIYCYLKSFIYLSVFIYYFYTKTTQSNSPWLYRAYASAQRTIVIFRNTTMFYINLPAETFASCLLGT